MNDYVDWLVSQYGHNGILIDSNILLLLVIGYYRPELIGRSRRTSHYLPEDFILAENVVRRFHRLLTLHSVLTEVSNLAGYETGIHRTNMLLLLGTLVQSMDERLVMGGDVARHQLFPRLGLTDVAILQTAMDGCVVFTDDFPLTGYLEHLELPVLNFNHVREAVWGL